MTRNKKQLLFLVLALAVLGVSLFGLFRKPAPQTAKKQEKRATQAKEQPKPTEEAQAPDGAGSQPASLPQTGAGRNPFAAPPGASATGQPAATSLPPEPSATPPGAAAAAPPEAAGGQTQPTITLSGIVTGEPSVAVIYYGDQRRYARVGDRVGDYRVQTIGRQEVVLVGPTGKLILRMGGRQ